MSDLAIVGDYDESVLWGEWNLLGNIVGKDRDSVWLGGATQVYEQKPRLILAFGHAAAALLVRDFKPIYYGQPVWCEAEDWIVLPIDTEIAKIATALAQVPELLTVGVKLAAPPTGPKTTDEFLGWPERISFLELEKNREGSCKLCGAKETVGVYEGNGLKWALCFKHALTTYDWAKANEPELYKQSVDARIHAQNMAWDRADQRMQAQMKEVWNAGNTEG